MKRSTDRIITTHAGSLPRPDDLMAMFRERAINDATLASRMTSAVDEVVRGQSEAGIDVINDGEFGKPTHSTATAGGAWASYVYDRISGFGPAPAGEGAPPRNPSGERKIVLVRHEQRAFPQYYEDTAPGSTTTPPGRPMCIGPISYVGQLAVAADIANLKQALTGVRAEEGFITSIAPGSVEVYGRGQHGYYPTQEAFLEAVATAMREEYRAIVEAGFVLQLDDPGLPDAWDMLEPLPTIEEYRRYAVLRVEALNHALAGLPEDRIRYHICWGSWHGPHTTDIPLRDVADVMLRVKAQAFVVEAGNVRHEHEWKVWRDVKLPDGKILVPGVVTHATNVVEHPEVVADRIERYANVVGRENVIAGTDCGLGGRVHPEIAWAKLRVLAEGAALASSRLWK